MTRTELREATFLILFRLDFYKNHDIEEQIDLFFEGEDNFTDDEKTYIGDKVKAISDRLSQIDDAIEAVSIGWKPRRMSKVDLTIMRLAYYEMKFDDSVPLSTAINEAVELAKNYGTENSSSFVNGILAKVAKND